jgi:riboflavin synthase
VAIDGTSLTVCEVDSRPEECWFTFMLVEYTQKKIIIPSKMVGALLNIEVDVLGKYSENALAAIMPRIQALESKVKELEHKLSILEGN